MTTYPTVQVGPFRLLDAPRQQVASAIADAFAENGTNRPTLSFACHVGGLNLRHDHTFVAAMQRADVTYADGVSVVALMKVAGAKSVERHPTTDLGWEVFETMHKRLGRPPKVALVGGPDGLAAAAGETITESGKADVVATEHGYHSDWTGVLERIRAADPDVVVVGMGMPNEALWTSKHFDELPPAIVLTCGGWFGYLVGNEKRAPEWMRRSGLEWVARLAQAPTRLWKRYAGGAVSTVAMMPTAYRGRSRRKPSRHPHQGF